MEERMTFEEILQASVLLVTCCDWCGLTLQMVSYIYIYMYTCKNILYLRYQSTHEISTLGLDEILFFATPRFRSFIDSESESIFCPLYLGVVGMKDMFFSFPFINGGVFCCRPHAT